MGLLLFVDDLGKPSATQLVLKCCRETDEELIKRFRREVRLLASFKGNSKVAQLWDHNVDYDPPYYVMRYYADGDLLRNADQFRNDPQKQESMILQLIDCLQELHSRNEYHRDIKPQNFLLDTNNIVVSDLGLSTELGSQTAFTRSSMYWGTHGYIPPEFLNGGFKCADAKGDIFMLGKTIYSVLSGREPIYLVEDGLPQPLFHIVERCCRVQKDQRYETLSELKQSVVAAFDVLLDRGGQLGNVKHTLSAINERLEEEGKYASSEVSRFIEQLALLEAPDQIRICLEMPRRFFAVMKQEPVADSLRTFLCSYQLLVESKDYPWSYAERIALNMKVLFSGGAVSNSNKAFALELGIRAAVYMNRFAAMDTCKEMVKGIEDESLGLEISTIILRNRETFIQDIEVSECPCQAVRRALAQVQSA